MHCLQRKQIISHITEEDCEIKLVLVISKPSLMKSKTPAKLHGNIISGHTHTPCCVCACVYNFLLLAFFQCTHDRWSVFGEQAWLHTRSGHKTEIKQLPCKVSHCHSTQRPQRCWSKLTFKVVPSGQNICSRAFTYNLSLSAIVAFKQGKKIRPTWHWTTPRNTVSCQRCSTLPTPRFGSSVTQRGVTVS